MATRRTYVLRLTTEGAEKVLQDLQKLGPAGREVADQLVNAAGRAGPALADVGRKATEARDKLREVKDEASSGGMGETVAGRLETELTRLSEPLGKVGALIRGWGPAGIAAAAGLGTIVTVGAAAFSEWSKTQNTLREIDLQTRRMGGPNLGASASGWKALIDDMARLPGVSRDAARQVAQDWAGTRGITQEMRQEMATLLADFAKFKGTDAAGAGKALAEMFRDPAAAAKTLTEENRLLTVAQLEAVESAQEQGRTAEALGIVLEALRPRIAGMAKEMSAGERASDTLDEAWDRLKTTIGDAGFFERVSGWLKRLAKEAVDAATSIIRGLDAATKPGPAWGERRVAQAEGWVRDQERLVAEEAAGLDRARAMPGVSPTTIRSLEAGLAQAQSELERLRGHLEHYRGRAVQLGTIGVRGGPGRPLTSREVDDAVAPMDLTTELLDLRKYTDKKDEVAALTRELANYKGMLAVLDDEVRRGVRTEDEAADAKKRYGQAIKAVEEKIAELKKGAGGAATAVFDLGKAFAGLDRAGTALDQAMGAISKASLPGEAGKLIQLAQAQATYRDELEKTATELAAGKIPADQMAEVRERLKGATERVAASEEAWARGVQNLGRELADGNEKLEERAEAAEFSNRILALEAEGTDEARLKIVELTKARNLEKLATEERLALAPMQATVAEAERLANEAAAKGLDDQAQKHRDVAAAVKASIEERQAAFGRLRDAAAQAPDLERLRDDARQARDIMTEPFREAARSIQQSMTGAADAVIGKLVGIGDKGADVGKQLVETFRRVAANIVGAWSYQTVVGGALDMVGASAGFQRSVGILPQGAGGQGGGGFSLPSIGGFDLGQVGGWLRTPFANIGGTETVYPTALGESTMVTGGFDIAPIDILGPVASAIPGLLSGNYIQAGLGAGGFALGNFLVPGIGGPIGGLLGNLVGGLFAKKPSNEGAESSFYLDDGFTDFFKSDKHPNRVAQVEGPVGDLQTLLGRASRRYGVSYQSDAVVGSTFGKKEGSSFFFDAADRDGGIENRVVGSYTDGDQASMSAAAEKVVVAAVKDGFRAAADDPEATQSARDIAVAMSESVAESFAELDVDMAFAKAFEDFAAIGSGALDPVGLAMKKLRDEGAELAQSIATGADTFNEKALSLGLGSELLADGTTRADAATKGYILSLLGLEGEIDGVEGATARAQATIDELVPVLERWGFTTEEIGDITERVMQQMVEAAEAAEAAAVRAAAQAKLALTTSIESAIDPNYMPSVASVFGAEGIDPNVYKTLFAAVSGAVGGSAEALRLVGTRLQANRDAKTLTEDQIATIAAFATQGYQRWVRLTQPVDQGDGGGDEGGGSTGSTRDREAEDRMQARIDEEEALNDVLSDRLDTERRLAESFREIAESMRLARQGLLTDPDLSPLSLKDQLDLALAQQKSAFDRVMAGGDDAPDAARELIQVTSRVQQLADRVFTSSDQSGDIFRDSIRMLADAEGKAQSYEQQYLAAANRTNDLLEASNTRLLALEAELKALRAVASNGGGSPPSGNPGTPGTPAPTLPTFGVANLGRGANETAADFLWRVFPQAATLLGADGSITEQEGYGWAQAQHGSGLGLTNAAYFASAIKAGYPLGRPFGYRAHENWMNEDATQGRWRAFIDALRERVSVDYGYFGIPYSEGGLITGGVPGQDSVLIRAMPRERMLTVEQNEWFTRVAAQTANEGWPAVVTELRGARRDHERTAGQDRADQAMVRREIADLRATMAGLSDRLDLFLANSNPGLAAGRNR